MLLLAVLGQQVLGVAAPERVPLAAGRCLDSAEQGDQLHGRPGDDKCAPCIKLNHQLAAGLQVRQAVGSCILGKKIR